MAFWTNLKKDYEKAKKKIGAKVKSTTRDFGEGFDIAKEKLGTPMQNLYGALTPNKSQNNFQINPQQNSFNKSVSPLSSLPTPDPSKDPMKSITFDNKSLSKYGQEAEKKQYDVFEKAGILPVQLQRKKEEENLAKYSPAPVQMGTAGKPQGILDAIKQSTSPTTPTPAIPATPATPITTPTASSEYNLLSQEGQNKVAEAEAATGLKGAEAIKAFNGRTTNPLQEGLDTLGMPSSNKELEADPTFQTNVKKATVGVSDPRTAETIKAEMAQVQSQINTLQWQLDRIPGVTDSDKKAYEGMMNTWAEGGASAEEIAQIVDNMTRADEDKISNQILPTYKKYLETDKIKKANQTMEDLYDKYSTTEKDLDNLRAEAEEAINAIKQSSYLTQSMIVGRVKRMSDEYNMQISAKQNQLDSLGKDIDRGRGSLKDMMTEGFKMAEIEIGSLELGQQEDILGKTGLGWESVAKALSAKEAKKAPETIGAGRFQYKDKSFEQVTPFAPKTPTSKQETQRIDQEHENYLQGLVSEGGFVPLDAFMEMAENWMAQTGKYDPTIYLSRFGRKYLSDKDKENFKLQMSGVKSY